MVTPCVGWHAFQPTPPAISFRKAQAFLYACAEPVSSGILLLNLPCALDLGVHEQLQVTGAHGSFTLLS